MKYAPFTQAEIKELFVFEPETGRMWWRESGKGRPANLIAGTPNQLGQIVVNINYQRYMLHHLAWLYVYGTWPSEIDHIDGNRSNNRINNLREVTHSQNLAAAKLRRDNQFGVPGLTWDSQKSRLKAQVGPAGKRLQKHFDSVEEARIWIEAKHIEIFGEHSRFYKKVAEEPQSSG